MLAVVTGRFPSHGLFNEVEDRFTDALNRGLRLSPRQVQCQLSQPRAGTATGVTRRPDIIPNQYISIQNPIQIHPELR